MGNHLRVLNESYRMHTNTTRFKVEPYPVPGSFLKLKYLKTELNVDYGTYAIV